MTFLRTEFFASENSIFIAMSSEKYFVRSPIWPYSIPYNTTPKVISGHPNYIPRQMASIESSFNVRSLILFTNYGDACAQRTKTKWEHEKITTCTAGLDPCSLRCHTDALQTGPRASRLLVWQFKIVIHSFYVVNLDRYPSDYFVRTLSLLSSPTPYSWIIAWDSCPSLPFFMAIWDNEQSSSFFEMHTAYTWGENVPSCLVCHASSSFWIAIRKLK